MRPKLSDLEIKRELGTLPGWSRRAEALTKSYAFQSFMDGIGFVNRVAHAAEAMDHHPDLDIRYTRVTCTLSTHDSGGITSTDVKLAREIERLVGQPGGSRGGSPPVAS